MKPDVKGLIGWERLDFRQVFALNQPRGVLIEANLQGYLEMPDGVKLEFTTRMTHDEFKKFESFLAEVADRIEKETGAILQGFRDSDFQGSLRVSNLCYELPKPPYLPDNRFLKPWK
jgi:hypothetical protein